jgi:monothiol glutaredoxin
LSKAPKKQMISIATDNGLGYIYSSVGFDGLMPAREVMPQGQCPKEANMSIEQFIDNEVKSNDVVLFMKGTPQFPQCGFSGQVVQILDHVGVGYKGLNVLESADLRDGIKTYSNWPTIPQLYVKGEFVGGCDIIREMFQAGELQQLLADKGVTVSAPATA